MQRSCTQDQLTTKPKTSGIEDDWWDDDMPLLELAGRTSPKNTNDTGHAASSSQGNDAPVIKF
jgi:hypothetical protein